MNAKRFYAFAVQGYTDCAFWTYEEEPEFADAQAADITLDDLDDQVRDFIDANYNVVEYAADFWTPEQFGHDLWLTRNRHGSGFWDRFNDNSVAGVLGNELTELAHRAGEVELYVGDNGLIYCI